MSDTPTTLTPPDSGTIDITNVVESLRQAWVSWAVAFAYGAEIAIPGMAWVAAPVISDIDREALKLIFDALSKAEVQMAFFLNTAVRKASQAQDFVAAVGAKNSLPSIASDAEFAAAEHAQMVEFRNFVTVTN